MKQVQCNVESITSLTEHVYKVLLRPEQKVDFLPGQYLNFIMDENDKRPFSIASSPNNELIELQIGAFGADSYPMQVIERIKANDSVLVEIPLGGAELRQGSDRPIILLAGGTGFSYIKSMFEYLADTGSRREVLVYWGLREPSACYELEQTANTVEGLAHGKFIPVIETPHDDWLGKTGMVHKVVMNDITNLADYDIYVAGRFDMVGVVRTDFVANGANINHMFADAFAYI
ncbi:NAD(P)H-flavin reductase [Thalassotalea sp. 1_MG-2023]|uniref:NAD(P)H-flavin reductase n=1 Tax=Thalassotalea sp. 1_MG-2023 TaxID=3062680 RepID=UPI0026E1F7F3|nr:NAD(P)H-flavin reductase [Thalassotalea sp. 1_MG-2023]MDO6425946.1 NAD(P)H-flavin reductase [Thalassotalea sp. 1_MG-2023]